MASILGTTGAEQNSVTQGWIEGALPTTVLTVFSKEILMYAVPKFRLMQFARMKRELERNAGDTIRLHRYQPLRKGKKLDEGVDIVPKTMDATTQDIKVEEYGNAVRLTERLLRTSAFDQLMIASKQLGDDYAFTTEVELLLTIDGLPSILYANEVVNRAALAVTDTMSAQTVRAAVEILKNKDVPPYRFSDANGAAEEVYICFINPHQARGMREDVEWREAVRYNHARRIFMGEIGMYEKVVFIETTMMPVILSNLSVGQEGHYLISGDDLSDAANVDDPITPDPSPHPTVDVNRAYIFGDYTYGFAEALPVEMRDEAPTDLGRKRKIGWYAIQGQALVNPDHGLIIETA